MFQSFTTFRLLWTTNVQGILASKSSGFWSSKLPPLYLSKLTQHTPRYLRIYSPAWAVWRSPWHRETLLKLVTNWQLQRSSSFTDHAAPAIAGQREGIRYIPKQLIADYAILAMPTPAPLLALAHSYTHCTPPSYFAKRCWNGIEEKPSPLPSALFLLQHPVPLQLPSPGNLNSAPLAPVSYIFLSDTVWATSS